jgi:hypothetical protein
MFCKELIAFLPWHDTECIDNDASNNSSTIVYSLPRSRSYRAIA